jgi:hypothetical protein
MRSTAIACLMSLFFAAAVAADRSVPLETGQTLSIRWGTDWTVGDPIPEAPHGAVTLHGPDPTKWRLTLAPLPPHPTLTGDQGNLRMYVRMMARGIENTGAQVDSEHVPVNGPHARGFQFKVRYSSSKPKRQIRLQGGDYAEGYTGALSIDGKAYLFEVLWNKGGEAAADHALAALKTISIR